MNFTTPASKRDRLLFETRLLFEVIRYASLAKPCSTLLLYEMLIFRFPVPQPVEMIEGTSICTHGIPGDEVTVVIRMISCGETHSVAVSDVGEVCTMFQDSKWFCIW